MNYTIPVTLLAVLSLLPSQVIGQFRDHPVGIVLSTANHATGAAYDYNGVIAPGPPVIVSMKDGTLLSGHLHSVSTDSMYLTISGERVGYAKIAVQSVQVIRPGRTPLLAGIALGCYAVDYAYQDGYTGYFVHRDDAPYVFEFMLMGSAAGSLVAWIFSRSDREVNYFFDESYQRTRNWRELQQIAQEGTVPYPLEIEVSTGWVSAPATTKYEVGNTNVRSNFTALRKFALYFSATPEFSGAMAYVSSAEPAHQYWHDVNYDPQYSYVNEPTSLRGDNFLGIFRYTKAPLTWWKGFTTHAEVGLGYAFYNFTTLVADQIPYSVDAEGLAVYAAAGFDIRVTQEVSLGLSADYTLGPSMMLPVTLSSTQNLESVRVGNGSVAMVVGWHF